MNDTLLAVAFLGPPALFGVLLAVEGFLDRRRWQRQAARWAAENARARGRHPSAWDGS